MMRYVKKIVTCAAILLALGLAGYLFWTKTSGGGSAATHPSVQLSREGTPAAQQSTPTTSSAVVSAPPRKDVVAFEKAYYIADSLKRKTALRPYVTDNFYKTLSTSEGMAAKAGSDVRVSLDVAYTVDRDGDVAYVSSSLTVQTSRNGHAISEPFTLPVHHTTWVLSASGTWLADGETILRK